MTGERLMTGEPLLEVHDLVVHHGQLRALDSISLRVFPGEVYAIIGANGAGKSTLLRTISPCLHRPDVRWCAARREPLLRDHAGPSAGPLPGCRYGARGGAMAVPGSLSVEENLEGRGDLCSAWARGTSTRVYQLFDWMPTRRNPARRPVVRGRAADGGDRPEPWSAVPADAAARRGSRSAWRRWSFSASTRCCRRSFRPGLTVLLVEQGREPGSARGDAHPLPA